jgi:hypothetical protein
MHCNYNACWLPLLEDRCAVLEALSEGWVLAHQAEMADEEGKRKEDFPCCVKCGGFCFCPIAGMRGVSEEPPISETQRNALARARGSDDINVTGGPKALRIQSASELTRSKKANAMELAVYQCATERFRDRDCYVAVDYDEAGNVHAYVRYPDGEMKNPQEMVASNVSCSCGGSHGE